MDRWLNAEKKAKQVTKEINDACAPVNHLTGIWAAKIHYRVEGNYADWIKNIEVAESEDDKFIGIDSKDHYNRPELTWIRPSTVTSIRPINPKE